MSVKLSFTHQEKCSVYKVAKMMAEADGVVLHEEMLSIETEMPKFGVSEDEYDELIVHGEKTSSIDALITIHSMDEKKKKLISSFLGYMVSIDDDIDDTELALWTFIVKVCGLPKMNVRQAVEIYRNF